MEGDVGDLSGHATVILAVVSYLGVLLMAGLMAAFFRVSGLYRNHLLEEESLARVLQVYLRSSRRFMVTVGTLYLVLTVLGAVSLGRILYGAFGTADARFLGTLVLAVVLCWMIGGLLVKQVAARTALGYARLAGTLIFPLYWLLRPWSAALLWMMERLDDTLWSVEAMPHLTPGEIRSLLSEDNGSVALEADEREMIHSIFGFGDTTVREIMVPRIDMISLEASDPVAAVVQQVNDAHHSRIPIHQGSVDRVTGILYAKDLLALVRDGTLEAGDKVVGDLARPAYYIPESKKIDDVLKEFRSSRIHMAIVIDEYGGTAGLVTLEDVLEEIVGEIEDEFDEEEQLHWWVDERRLRVDPKIDLEDLQEISGLKLPDEDVETLGGLIYEAAGNVPEPGDVVQIAGVKVTVEKVADQRILQVLLEAPEPLPGHARRVEGTTPG